MPTEKCAPKRDRVCFYYVFVVESFRIEAPTMVVITV